MLLTLLLSIPPSGACVGRVVHAGGGEGDARAPGAAAVEEGDVAALEDEGSSICLSASRAYSRWGRGFR